jgi:hypothetical protein
MDDFVYAYYRANLQTPLEPGNAAFLPFHRTVVRLYDQALTNECGYRGPFPYWDWTLDASNPGQSTVWKDFGGITECLNTAELPNWTSHYQQQKWEGRTYRYVNCVFREIDPLRIRYEANPNRVLDILRKKTFHEFRTSAEYLIVLVHHCLYGDVADPLAFLSFRNLDRIWAKWQAQVNNVNQYYGTQEVKTLTPHGKEYNLRSVSVYDSVDLYGLVSHDIRVQHVMQVGSGNVGGLMCYKYIDTSVARAFYLRAMQVLKSDISILWKPQD